MNERYLNPNMVTFTCQDCGSPFRAIQGSKQRYCEKCLLRKVKQGRPKKVLVIGTQPSKELLNSLETIGKLKLAKVVERNPDTTPDLGATQKKNKKVVGFSKGKQTGKKE
jgi:DNA-directed RNA polymerase subunit RPC12/RpoP